MKREFSMNSLLRVNGVCNGDDREGAESAGKIMRTRQGSLEAEEYCNPGNNPARAARGG